MTGVFSVRCLIAALSILWLLDHSVVADESANPSVTRLTTPDGIEYGIWGALAKKPAPTLFMLAGTIERLGVPYYRQCGNELAEFGYLVVSIDLPCHGTQITEGQPTGLAGWGHRVGNGEDFVAEANARLSKVLDHLIMTGRTDSARVAAAGTSRGGFIAIHFAAHDPRVKAAAGFAPVTDLAGLLEFRAIREDTLVKKLSLKSQAEKLAGRPVWIVIGDVDERVGTDHAIELARRLSALAKEKKVASRVDLHVVSEPRGHTTPVGATKLAAAWVHRQLTGKELPTVTAVDINAAKTRAVTTLREAVRDQEKFVKVHAAEACLGLDIVADVYSTFQAEETRFGQEPKHRVVIWRVLAQSAPDESEKQIWRARIAAAFLDEQGPDRLHAVEALAKLGHQILPSQRDAFQLAISGTDSGMDLFTSWVFARQPLEPQALESQPKPVSHELSIAEYLHSDDEVARLRAAYILRHLSGLTPKTRSDLFQRAKSEPEHSIAHAYLAGSALVVASRNDLDQETVFWHAEVIRIASHASAASQRATACQSLAEVGTIADLSVLQNLMQDVDPDVQVFAAHATCSILARTTPGSPPSVAIEK